MAYPSLAPKRSTAELACGHSNLYSGSAIPLAGQLVYCPRCADYARVRDVSAGLAVPDAPPRARTGFSGVNGRNGAVRST